MLNKGSKDLGDGSPFNRHGRQHASQAHRPNDGVQPASLNGFGFVEPSSFQSPTIQRGHRLIRPRFVDEDQVIGVDHIDFIVVPLSKCFDSVGILLGGHKRFFLRVYPQRCQ